MEPGWMPGDEVLRPPGIFPPEAGDLLPPGAAPGDGAPAPPGREPAAEVPGPPGEEPAAVGVRPSAGSPAVFINPVGSVCFFRLPLFPRDFFRFPFSFFPVFCFEVLFSVLPLRSPIVFLYAEIPFSVFLSIHEGYQRGAL